MPPLVGWKPHPLEASSSSVMAEARSKERQSECESNDLMSQKSPPTILTESMKVLEQSLSCLCLRTGCFKASLMVVFFRVAVRSKNKSMTCT